MVMQEQSEFSGIKIREKYLSINVLGKKRDGNLSQMIWRCFMRNKLGPLVYIDENINKDMYIAMSKQNLLGFIDVLVVERFQGSVEEALACCIYCISTRQCSSSYY